MADNTTLNTGSGGDTIASDDIVGVKYQRVKLTVGADGVNDGDVASANPLPVAGTVDLGTTDNAVLDAIAAAATAIQAAVEVIDNSISGSETQVDIVSSALPTGAATAANQATQTTSLQLIDNPVVAHDAAVSGATGAMMSGYNARSADPTAVASADATYALATLLGKQVVQPYAIPASTWGYAAASGGITDTTGVTAKAAAGAGVRNYITAVQVINGHASVNTDVQIRDGASGTVLWRGFAQAGGGGVSAEFNPPLRGTANTLVQVACGTTGTATYFNLQGYTAAE